MIVKTIRSVSEVLRPWFFLVAVFFAVALVGRLMVVKIMFPEWTLSVWGIVGDLLAAVFAASVLFLLRASHPIPAFLWLVLWLVLLAANAEHIYALNEPLRLGNFQFALDINFVRGSLLSLHTWPFAVIAVAAGAWVWRRLSKNPKNTLALFVCAFMAVSSAATSLRLALGASYWRHASPMALMLSNALADSFSYQTPIAAAGGADIDNFFVRDVSGERLTTVKDKPTNVLLVVLEGISGAYLAQSREITGFQSRLEMPNLSRIADTGFVLPNFVSHGVGTIGGLYSLYCGDYSQTLTNSESIKPFLLLDLPPEKIPQCLPQKLRQAGYSTAYLQAADLRYMKKSDFLPNIGFERVAGKGDFAGGDLANFWGAGDGDLLSAALGEIERLRAIGKPWFLSLLSVGTHHPYIAPDDYIVAAEGNRKTAAVRYLDDILGVFVEELRARGVLEDTLVIFTSDESHGVLGHPFGGHWGLFVALGDGVPERLSPQVFGQADVALSVLDYLGMDNENFLGRSIFRDNTAFRPMPFGRFILDSPGRVFSCKREFCDLYQWETGGLFAPAYRVSQIPAAAAALSSQKQRNVFARANLFLGRGANAVIFSQRDIFLALKQQQIQPYKLFLPQKSQVEVVLNVENTGEAAAHFYAFWGNSDGEKLKQQPNVRLPALPSGAGFELTYSFYNEKAQNAVFNFVALSHKEQTNAVMRELKISATPSDNRDFNVKHFQIYAQDIAVGRDKNGARVFVDDLENANQNDEGIKFLALAQTSNANDAFFAPRHKIGEWLDFSANGPWRHALALAADWSIPEPWGVWSSGNRPALVMWLGDIAPEAEYELRYKFIPYISPAHTGFANSDFLY